MHTLLALHKSRRAAGLRIPLRLRPESGPPVTLFFLWDDAASRHTCQLPTAQYLALAPAIHGVNAPRHHHPYPLALSLPDAPDAAPAPAPEPPAATPRKK